MIFVVGQMKAMIQALLSRACILLVALSLPGTYTVKGPIMSPMQTQKGGMMVKVEEGKGPITACMNLFLLFAQATYSCPSSRNKDRPPMI